MGAPAPIRERADSPAEVSYELDAGRLHLLREPRIDVRHRRRRRRALALALVLAAIVGLVLFADRLDAPPTQAPLASGPPAERAGSAPGVGAGGGGPQNAAQIRRRIDGARAWVEDRPGLASFAIVGSDGRVRGHAEHRTYVSASVVKAMLLVAEARRLADGDLPLDPSTESTLRAMITYSDNAAADAIYGRVGDAGLYGVADRVGMEDFSVSGYWANAQISAHDMALLFNQLDRAFPDRRAKLGKGLLGSIIAGQSWGVPAALGQKWNVRFKGGWRGTDLGQLVHQAAEAKRGDRAYGLAVLTDRQPSMSTGIETVEGVTRRLVGG